MPRPDNNVPNVVRIDLGNDFATFTIDACQPGRDFPDYGANFVTLVYIDLGVRTVSVTDDPGMGAQIFQLISGHWIVIALPIEGHPFDASVGNSDDQVILGED